MHTRADWIVEPFEDPANRNTPPTLKFESGAKTFAGPPIGLAATYTVEAGVPLPLVAFAADEGPKINVPEPSQRRSRGNGAAPIAPPRLAVSWSVFRGSGAVTFAAVKPAIGGDGRAATTATFTTPGEYVLRLQANDSTGDGGGGFQCCWTNVHVAVTVKPSRSTAP
jgi:hypothetical protein